MNHGVGWLETSLERAQLALGVSAVQEPKALASVFRIRLTVAERKSIQEAFKGVLAALADLHAGVSDEEIERVRRRFENDRLFALESSFGLAESLDMAARLGPLPAVFDGGLGRYRRITPASVRAAVRTWLGQRPWVIGAGHPMRIPSVAGELVGIQEAAW
ncbi:Hypothetical protein A7982_03575 [Minicystis rosea]|nr:Hypothetical protein A7982_03575 [Minicystis rosea]